MSAFKKIATPNVVNLTIANCQDCPFHRNVTTQYTGDSFDMVDEDTLCVHPVSAASRYAERAAYVDVRGRVVTGSNRPWQIRKESTVPAWCPLQVSK